MNRSTKLVIAAAAAIASVSVGVLAAAQNDAVIPAPAAISLVQAIQAAERHATGRAIRAEYEAGGKPRIWTYDIEVVASATVFDVKVDATNGTIISSKEDVADRDDGGDQD
jgi:uncharacterized membrane protein YkoI